MRRTISIILRLIVSVMLIWALDKHLNDYYTLLRWVTCGSAAYFWYRASELGVVPWQWLFGVITLLFNPIIPVHLSKDAWELIDFIVALIFLGSFFFLREPKYASGEPQLEEGSQRDNLSSLEEYRSDPTTRMMLEYASKQIDLSVRIGDITREAEEMLIAEGESPGQGTSYGMQESFHEFDKGWAVFQIVLANMEKRGADMTQFNSSLAEAIEDMRIDLAQTVLDSTLAPINEQETIFAILSMLKIGGSATYGEIDEYIRSSGKLSVSLSDSLQGLYEQGELTHDDRTDKWSITDQESEEKMVDEETLVVLEQMADETRAKVAKREGGRGMSFDELVGNDDNLLDKYAHLSDEELEFRVACSKLIRKKRDECHALREEHMRKYPEAFGGEAV